MKLEVTREAVLSHRLGVQDLAQPVWAAVDCRVLSLGVQNTPATSGLIALSARTSQPARALTELLDVGGPLAVVMAMRGAPHLVTRSELPLLTAALCPVGEQGAAEVAEVARAMRESSGGERISRPALSEAINDRVPDSLRDWCERCRSRHVREGLFRQATLQAGLELDTAAASPTVFRPSDVELAPSPDRDQARVELARRYIHLTGAVRSDDLAAWFGCKVAEVRETWSMLTEEMTPCDVAGKRRWMLTSDAGSLSNAPGMARTTLLPPYDPYLLGDRSLVVPEREDQRRLWRAQASPGAVLVNGEIAGTWRHGIKRHQLQVTLTPFRAFDTAVTHDLEPAAHEIAALRKAREVNITLEE
jgi:hypothetical protein